MAFAANRNPHLRRGSTDLLADCDPEQAEAITSTASPLCVLAAAGSGKTRVLTRRIAWRVQEGSAAAAHVLALTFTRKAAVELRSRLFDLGLPEDVTAGTFHSVALAELKRLAAENRQRPPVVLASKARLLADVLTGGAGGSRSADRAKSGPNRASRGAQPLAELAQDIEWAKARCLEPAQFEKASALAGRRGSRPPGETAAIWSVYEREKQRRGVLDFEDLLRLCRYQLLEDREFAASARWRYRHVFVDEYQDVNLAQQRLLEAWLGPNRDLCVVGDPRQAIYAWNGSNPRAMAEFSQDFPGAAVLELSTNYRSTSELLTVAGAVLGGAEPPVAGGRCPEGPVPTIVRYEDDESEAAGIAERARVAHRPGRPWSQIAVLARTNAQLPAIERALRAAGVPCRVVGASAFLSRPAVRAAVDEASWARDATALGSLAADLIEAAAGPRSPDRDLESLALLLRDYLAEDVGASGKGWLAWLESCLRGQDEPGTQDEVELMTFHRAKGLEWTVVFVAGLEDGYVPLAHATSEEAIAEERRLLYVACTRACEELHCSWAAERAFGTTGSGVARAPSPWLRAIEAAHRELLAARKSSTAISATGLAASRRALGLT
ncbi:MAG: ATP-dependent helicase [Acidimicrobiales bacterium]